MHRDLPAADGGSQETASEAVTSTQSSDDKQNRHAQRTAVDEEYKSSIERHDGVPVEESNRVRGDGESSKANEGGESSKVKEGEESSKVKGDGTGNEDAIRTVVDDDNNAILPARRRTLSKIWQFLGWMPRRCRYDPKHPFVFGLPMNILLGFAGTFTVANLYYAQPILNVIGRDFGVAEEKAASVATLSQAGYAAGLLFLCPLGDKVRRRPFVLLLIGMTATVWLGLCLTSKFDVFLALSFICGVGTVTPQLMLPLVGDLAPPHRRASSLSIVVSALAMGVLLARILSGVVANYTHWRTIYWLALGLQYLILALLFLFLPDYPAKDPGLNYAGLLRSIVVLVAREPLLLQACLTGFLLSAAFTSFWTTLTFLLAAPPYGYSSLEIGLFALIGLAVIALGPLWSRLITDRFVPLFSVLLGLAVEFVGVVVGTFVGPFSVAGPVVMAILMDAGGNFAHTANRTNVYNLDPRARNRVNTAYMVFSFAGQLTGTAVGNRLYAEGGWIWSGSCNIAFIGAAIFICLARGPRETHWLGWRGGWKVRRDPVVEGVHVPEDNKEGRTRPVVSGAETSERAAHAEEALEARGRGG